ncbi:DUF3164 family protein [Riemerella anatipestifer]|uniref:DUF3164 family protein n=1 Tax=Riemerella anatipestifer TaxID=34085 RepID=UPI0021D58076|nr:DUF3164 family protein [Riemerella anatipestifer]MCU7543483.1 DUF3164 family protein [Riemerella anatipestifer]MCW0514294.1 DUF3164 family protein [Riemerella anatipestifer]
MNLKDLSPEQKDELRKQLEAEKKATRERKLADKKLLKKLEDSLVLENIDYFITQRDNLEYKILSLFKEIETIIDLRAQVYSNKKREQDSHTFTLDDGSASIKIGWNVRPIFNGTEVEGIVKIKEYMSSLAGETENEKILMEFLNVALKTDIQGNYNPKKVRELNSMREKAKSELFNEGMDIVNAALHDIRTSRYVRGYKMVNFGDGNIRRVNFNFSID